MMLYKLRLGKMKMKPSMENSPGTSSNEGAYSFSDPGITVVLGTCICIFGLFIP
jgi:hypothetical protein